MDKVNLKKDILISVGCVAFMWWIEHQKNIDYDDCGNVVIQVFGYELYHGKKYGRPREE